MPDRSRIDFEPFLARLTLRSVLNEEERQAVRDLPAKVVEVADRADHVALGEGTEDASLVVSGTLGRFDQNADGVRQITALHIPGDMANLQSVV